ncbi:hypothetical protein [Microbacterium sp. MYb64]|uniref:hypothetical protein n=1 Tax=Microbacterium sp. MYb64 TaxID=1848691 RepID=UPI000CFD1D97|nr:hypothetical protein [Microbacterium sp. MYb64]PRB01751.1 hypothetical protein CQ044_16515 [Microbacterium sp. MYb64]
MRFLSKLMTTLRYRKRLSLDGVSMVGVREYSVTSSRNGIECITRRYLGPVDVEVTMFAGNW